MNAAPDAIGYGVARDAPFFVVLNAGSGKHEDEDVRVAVQRTLTSAGRTVFVQEVSDAAELADVARDAVARTVFLRTFVLPVRSSSTRVCSRCKLGS